jgi:hypothetical protein
MLSERAFKSVSSSLEMGMSLRVIAELIILFGRICCALVAVVGTMAFASYLIASPVDATPRMDAESGAIWTLVPVHIDLSHQPYEREPDRYPFKFSAGPALKVIDNATFSLDGNTFVIAGVARIAPRALCADAQGRRLACGQNAAGLLRTALRRSFIECSSKELAPKLFMMSCRRDGQDLTGLLNDMPEVQLVASAK